jgi:hypothetical protein
MDPRRVIEGRLCTAGPQCVRADENRHGPAMPGDDYFLAVLDAIEQLRQCGSSLGSAHGGHGSDCTGLYIGVQQGSRTSVTTAWRGSTPKR